MSTEERFEQALHHVLWLVRPYLPELVVIGGWVPHLYRRYGGFHEWGSTLSRTAEVDVLLPQEPPRDGRPPLAQLLREAGFTSTQESRGAIWMNDVATGEKVEFFVPHAGTATSIGQPRPLPAQDGLGAIPLTDLTLLARHTRALQIPVAITIRRPEMLSVRVPSIGAYLVGKGATFMKRSPATSPEQSRRAKDIVYIRDVMAAGTDVVRQVERDIIELRALSDVASYMLYAGNNLSLLDRGSAVLQEAARELAERDGMRIEDARLDLEGHVLDLRELLGGG